MIVDGSSFPKKGEHSAGVSRQWCGQIGKLDNCQTGVFRGYVSRLGYTLLDAVLHLPPCWFEEDYAQRRRKRASSTSAWATTKFEPGADGTTT